MKQIIILLMVTLPIIGLNAQDEVFKVVEDMPRFSGCETVDDKMERQQCAENQMLDYIYDNIVYPEIDKTNKTEGRAIVQFVINKDGKTSDLRIVRSLSPTIDQSINDLFELMNEEITWVPGKHNGEVKRVLYTLPILYRLPKE